MRASDRPIVVATTVPHEHGIKITLPTGSTIIRAHSELVWSMLERCDGQSTKQSVIDDLEKQFPGLESNLVEQAFDQLERMKVLLDQRLAFKAMLAELAFPPLQSPGLSPTQVRKHVESQRLPVANGDAFQLDHDPSGTVARLQAARRSCNSFSLDDDIDPHVLAQLLTCTYSIPLHSTPSGGRLYPLKIYLILTRTQGKLPAGYYEYDPEQHVLVRYNDQLDAEVLKYAFNSDPLLHNAPAIVVIAADLNRQPYKYGNGGFVLTLLEAGHAAQNLLLASAEHKMSSLEYKSFRNAAVAAELGFNEGLEDEPIWPIISVAIGHRGPDLPYQPELELENLTVALMAPAGPLTGLQLASRRGQTDPGFAAAHATAATVGTSEITYGSGSALTEIGALIAAAAEAYERHVSGLVRVEMIASADELSSRGERWLDPRTIVPLREQQLLDLGLDAFDPPPNLAVGQGRRG
jgi:SagB-type dehydrogenase family enzyme